MFRKNKENRSWQNSQNLHFKVDQSNVARTKLKKLNEVELRSKLISRRIGHLAKKIRSAIKNQRQNESCVKL